MSDYAPTSGNSRWSKHFDAKAAEDVAKDLLKLHPADQYHRLNAMPIRERDAVIAALVRLQSKEAK